MAIPYKPLPVGTTLQGKVTWFGGPGDHSDSGHTALEGIPHTGRADEAAGGIAVYNRATLGGYWRVEINGHSQIERQTDLGPNAYTGAVGDILYSSLHKYGYTQQNFPNPQAKLTYLGKTLGGHIPVTHAGLGTPAVTGTALASTPTRDVTKAHGSDLLYALLFAGAVVTGMMLIGLGLNRGSDGTLARVAKRAAVVAVPK